MVLCSNLVLCPGAVPFEIEGKLHSPGHPMAVAMVTDSDSEHALMQ